MFFTWSGYSVSARYWNSKKSGAKLEVFSWNLRLSLLFLLLSLSQGSVPSENHIASLSISGILFAYEVVCVKKKKCGLWLALHFIKKSPESLKENLKVTVGFHFILVFTHDLSFKKTNKALSMLMVSPNIIKAVIYFYDDVCFLVVFLFLQCTNGLIFLHYL